MKIRRGQLAVPSDLRMRKSSFALHDRRLSSTSHVLVEHRICLVSYPDCNLPFSRGAAFAGSMLLFATLASLFRHFSAHRVSFTFLHSCFTNVLSWTFETPLTVVRHGTSDQQSSCAREARQPVKSKVLAFAFQTRDRNLVGTGSREQ